MASLSTKVKLYGEANSKTIDFTKDVHLQDDSDGKGPYIKEWNVDGLSKPTDDQLATYETAGNTEETNNTVRSTRKAAYGDIGNVDGLSKPTDDQLATYETAGNTEETNNTVRSTRKAAYGDIGDQLDEIYKDIDAWKVRIKAVKDANPKS